jgi:MFS family permease
MSSEAPEPIAPPTGSRVGGFLRRVAVDVEPLRVSTPFRHLWLGLLCWGFGYQFTLLAIFIQVKELTGSEIAVGLTGLVGLIALVLGTLVGATFVDVFDRRSTLIGAQLTYMAAAAILLVAALHGHPPLWVIYAAVALLAAESAVNSPVRAAMTPRLIGVELLPSAAALNQVVFNATALAGPAAAGLVIARFGLSWAYLIDLVSALAMLWAAVRLPHMPPERTEGAATGWRAVREGFSYLRGRPVLQSTFVIDIIAMVFGLPRALFAFLAVSQFHRGAEVVGFLFAAPAFGALLAALTTGWVKHVRRQGLAVIWAVVLWGAGITAFGLVGDHLWLALALLAFAGGADVISAVFRNTILQVTVPDALRGRLSQIHILVVTGGPRLGDFEAGLVAAAFTPTISVVSGGVLSMLGAGLVALLVPSFRRYRAGEEG